MKLSKDLRIGSWNVLSLYSQEVGGEKLEECCKEQGQLAAAFVEGLGSKLAVVPMMMMMMMIQHNGDVSLERFECFCFVHYGFVFQLLGLFEHIMQLKHYNY
jgi:hypothetical protein